MKFICENGGYDYPEVFANNGYDKDIKVICVDEETYIPYMFINRDDHIDSKISRPLLSDLERRTRAKADPNNEKTDDFSENHLHKNILVVFHDFYDNFIPMIEQYRNIVKYNSTNYSVLLFNYPGQSYTMFQPGTKFNNIGIAQAVDQILFDLERYGSVCFLTDRLVLAGYGYGGNIALCYQALLKNSLVNLEALLLINPIVYMDNQIHSIIKDYTNELQNTKINSKHGE